MALTVRDLVALLRREDPTTVLELLDIASEDLVDRFEDFIETQYDRLVEVYEDEIFGKDDDEDEEELGFGRVHWPEE